MAVHLIADFEARALFLPDSLLTEGLLLQPVLMNPNAALDALIQSINNELDAKLWDHFGPYPYFKLPVGGMDGSAESRTARAPLDREGGQEAHSPLGQR